MKATDKAVDGITILRFSRPPKKQGEPPRLRILDASTSERAKNAWETVFKSLDADNAFSFLTTDKYRPPFRPESLVKTLRQLLSGAQGTKVVVQDNTITLEHDGACYRISVTEECAPTRETSEGYEEWERLCILYKEAKAGNSQAMALLCMKQPGVSAEVAETCKLEAGA